MSTTIRFPVKLFLAACVVAVTLGDPSRASAQNYTNPAEWTEGQLRSHFNIHRKDLLEVREKLAEVRDDMRTQRTASRSPQTRREYQALFQAKLQRLLRQEQRLLRELRAIRDAVRLRTAPTAGASVGTPSAPRHGTPVIPTHRPTSSKEEFLAFVRGFLAR